MTTGHEIVGQCGSCGAGCCKCDKCTEAKGRQDVCARCAKKQRLQAAVEHASINSVEAI